MNKYIRVRTPGCFFVPTDVVVVQLFNLLWLIRRAQQSLSAAWKHRMTSRRKREPRSGHEQKILQSFHKWDLLRSHMVHFVSNLQHYISFEVLTPSWQAFMQVRSLPPPPPLPTTQLLSPSPNILTEFYLNTGAGECC